MAVIAVRAVLYALRLPLVIAGHITALVLRWYVFHFVQVNARAKCPACGCRVEHDVRWSYDHGVLVHMCKRCFAPWTEQPVVKVEAWQTTLAQTPVDGDDEDTINADGTRSTTTQHAQREPQLSYQPTGRRTPVIVHGRRGDTA